MDISKLKAIWKLRICLYFKWFDLWIGAYYDRRYKMLYIQPLPTVGIRIKLVDDVTLYKQLKAKLKPEEFERLYKGEWPEPEREIVYLHEKPK